MIRALVPIVFLAAGSSLAAQLSSEAVSPSGASPREAWKQFQKAHGSEWTVQWNPATGTPAAIYGRGLDLPGKADTLTEARRRATSTLTTYADLLGRGNSKFVETMGDRMNKVWVFVYEQQFRGLDVVGGRADVRVHESGGISMFGATAFPIPAAFSLVPAVAKENARGIAYKARGVAAPKVPMAGENARLVIWGNPRARAAAKPRLAWEITISYSEKVTGQSFIDALTGAELAFDNWYHECAFGCTAHKHAPGKKASRRGPSIKASYGKPRPNPAGNAPVIGKVQAWTNTGLKPTDALKLIPVKNVRVQVVGGNSGFTDQSGNFSIPHTGNQQVQVRVVFAGRHVRTINPSQGTKLNRQVSATPNTPVTITIYSPTVGEHDFAQSTGYWGHDDVTTYLTAINGPLPNRINDLTVNTSLNRTCNATFSGGSFATNYYHKGGSCNMTCYTTVIYHEWGHAIDFVYGGISQTDGLSEGWGDLMAIYRTGQPIVGDAFRTNGGFVRTALNTFRYPAGGGVHQQGQTWMGFAWDLRENLRKSKGSAGIAIAEKIVLTTLKADATNQPNAVREVFLADDDDNNLNNGTPHYDELVAAAQKRRLPFPERKFCSLDSSFATYGTGCRTKAQNCAIGFNVNWKQSLSNQTTTASRIGILEFNRPETNVCGIDLFTRSRTGTVPVTIAIQEVGIRDGKPGRVLASARVTVGPAPRTYSVKLAPTLIPKDDIFVITFDNADKLILPAVSSGEKSTHYEFRNNQWSDLVFTIPFQYRVYHESGARIPRLTNKDLPVLGKSFAVNLEAAPAGKPAMLFVGSSKTAWGPLRLPFDLAAGGAPGCNILAAGNTILTLATSGNGSATVPFALPLAKNLCNIRVYFQFLVIDGVSNQLGVVVSNAGDALFGN